MNIAVYCGWRDVPSREIRLGQQVGEQIAAQGCRLVYGGGILGTMGAVAAAAKTGGATVTAVTKQEWAVPEDSQWDKLVITETLAERKTVMDGLADAVLVLPGRIGTLAELFTSIECGYGFDGHGRRPVVVVDPWGYYQGLLEWLPTVLHPEHLPMVARNAADAVSFAIQGASLRAAAPVS